MLQFITDSGILHKQAAGKFRNPLQRKIVCNLYILIYAV